MINNGVPADIALRTDSTVDVLIYAAIAEQVAEYRQIERENLATDIANKLGQVLGG